MKILALILTSLFLLMPSSVQAKSSQSFAVTLNHFYLTLDAETYAAIENSEFLQKEFAAFERRTTVRTDRTYTGIYFYGTHTYFEFFDATKQTEFKLHDSGLAFGVERTDDLKILQARFTATAPALITRQYNGLQVPWFFMLHLESYFPNSVIHPWVMEYHPKFLVEWHPEGSARDQGILKNQILRRYKKVLKGVPPRPYFRDVIGLTIAADSASVARMIELGRKFGYHARRDREATVLDGPELELRLIPEAPNARGIKKVIFSVGQVPRKLGTLTFGRSILEFQPNGRAVWSF